MLSRAVPFFVVLTLLGGVGVARAQTAQPLKPRLSQAPAPRPPAPALNPATPAPRRPATQSMAGPSTFQLDNGLRVILHSVPGSPLAAVRLTILSGSTSEPKRRPGLAHLTEHIAFGSTKHIPHHLLEEALEIGALSPNGTTTMDSVDYFETVPASRLAQALRMESERLAFLLENTNQELLRKEQRIVERETAMRLGPDLYFWEHRHRYLFPKGHPYHMAGRAEDEPHRSSLSDVRAFFQGTHRPDNAVLTLVGGFSESRARALVQKYFGPLSNPNTPVIRAHVPDVSPPLAKTRIVGYRGTDTVVGVDFLLPRTTDLKTWHIHRMIMFHLDELMEDELLEGGRVANHLWTGVTLGPGPNRLHVTTYAPPTIAFRSIVSKMHQTAQKAVKDTEGIFARKRERELEIRNIARTVQGRASMYAFHFGSFGRVHSTAEQLAILNSITRLDIEKVVAAHLKADRARFLVFLPGTTNPAGDILR